MICIFVTPEAFIDGYRERSTKFKNLQKFDFFQTSHMPSTLTHSLSLLNYSLLNFYKYHQLFVNNQWILLDFLIF